MFRDAVVIVAGLVLLAWLARILIRPPEIDSKPARPVGAARRWLEQRISFGRYGREVALSLAAFAILLLQYSWQAAVTLAAVILWHEYGHLLAYRMTGRKGNRLMLVPFFGGIATASAPHRSEFERAFCALAGPAISAPLTLIAMLIWLNDPAPEVTAWAGRAMVFSALLNLLNLLPIYPLDGGHTVESLLRTYMPGAARHAMIGLTVAGLLALAAMGYLQATLFLALFSAMSLSGFPATSALRRMTTAETAKILLGVAFTAAAHGLALFAWTNIRP